MQQKTLADKFNEAALRIGGTMDTKVFRAEVRNFCEKFGLLWDSASTPEEKNNLAGSFASIFLQTAAQIRTQTTVGAVQAQTEATSRMYATLRELAPEWMSKNNLDTQLYSLARETRQAAAVQTNGLARGVLLESAALLQRISTVIENQRPAADRRFGR